MAIGEHKVTQNRFQAYVRPPRVIKWPKVICPSNSAANNKSANSSAISAILIALCAH